MKKIFFALPFVLLAACNNSSDYDTTSTDKKDTIINTPFDSGKTVSKSGNPGFKDTTSYERQATTTPTDTSK
jgi:hypothetical protein